VQGLRLRHVRDTPAGHSRAAPPTPTWNLIRSLHTARHLVLRCAAICPPRPAHARLWVPHSRSRPYYDPPKLHPNLPPRRFMDKNAGGCANCPAGTFSNSNTGAVSECQACSDAGYQDETGQTSCKTSEGGHV